MAEYPGWFYPHDKNVADITSACVYHIQSYMDINDLKHCNFLFDQPLCWLNLKKDSIGSTVSVEKSDSPLEIESESIKWMDVSSALNVAVLIETLTFSVSSWDLYSVKDT